MKSLARQSIRFVVVGMVNTAIGLAAIYVLMLFFGVGLAISNAVGYAIGMGVSFSLNRIWTFTNNRPVAHVLPKYLIVVVISYALNLGVVLAAASTFFISPYLLQLAGVFVYTTCMFIGCRWFVFAVDGED